MVSFLDEFEIDWHNEDENDTVLGSEEYGLPTVSYVIAWIVIWIGFPLTLMAIYALYSLIQDNHVAPVYVINLMVSDLIQMCCFVIWVAAPRNEIVYTSKCIHFVGLMASVGFMACISVERYLVVACPLWYRFRRSIKISVSVSILMWALSFVDLLTRLLIDSFLSRIIHSILLLLPFPLLIFTLVGTLKALSAASSVPLSEKRRIVGTLVLVLLIYTVLFLPWIIWLVTVSYRDPNVRIYSVSDAGLFLPYVQFSPLADLILYVFMRKGAIDKLLASLCFCRVMGEQKQGEVSADDIDVSSL